MKTLKTLVLAAVITLTLGFATGTAEAGEPFHPFWEPEYNTNVSSDAYYLDFVLWYYGW